MCRPHAILFLHFVNAKISVAEFDALADELSELDDESSMAAVLNKRFPPPGER